MDYEQIIEEQIRGMDLGAFEQSGQDAIRESGIFDPFTVEELVHHLMNGQPLFDSDQIMENMKNLFFMEIKASVAVGCEILAVCIILGLLNGFSDSFGSKTVSALGTVLCSCVIIALCIGNFYQAYDYCQSTVDAMSHTMELLLPIMIPLLVATGGISSGSLMDPAIMGAITGFNFLMLHLVLPLVFLSAVFVLINSITEKDYVKKLSSFLRKGAIFLTGLTITVFTGITAIQGVVTKSADGILMNTAKFSLDNFIPIVGGFAADSLELVIGCVSLVKSAVGVLGIIVILSLMVIPVLKLLSIAVIYKVIAIAAEPIASKNISDSLSEIGTAAITMTVVLGLGTMMFLIFITIIMGMGGGAIWNS